MQCLDLATRMASTATSCCAAGEFTRTLLWVPRRDELVFAAGPALVVMSPGSPQQRHLLGHTAYVCAMAFDGEGGLMATAQEGKQAVVRVWDFATGRCLAVLCGEWLRTQVEAMLMLVPWFVLPRSNSLCTNCMRVELNSDTVLLATQPWYPTHRAQPG